LEVINDDATQCPFLKLKGIIFKKPYCVAVFPECEIPLAKEVKKGMARGFEDWMFKGYLEGVSYVNDVPVCIVPSQWAHCIHYAKLMMIDEKFKAIKGKPRKKRKGGVINDKKPRAS